MRRWRPSVRRRLDVARLLDEGCGDHGGVVEVRPALSEPGVGLGADGHEVHGPVVIEASTGRTTRASSVAHRPVSPARPPGTDTIRHELSAGLRLRHWPDLP